MSLLGDLSATVLGLLEDSELLERLDDLSLNGSRAVSVVRGSVSTVDGSSVQLLEGTDSDVLSQVDVSGDRGGSNVVPNYQ